MKIKDEDNTIKNLSKEVEIDLFWEGNFAHTKEGGEIVELEKDGKKYPVVIKIDGIEKSMTSASYLGGSWTITPQTGSQWKIESRKLAFPNQGRHFSKLILILVISLIIIAILAFVGWYLWKRKKKR